MAPPDAARPSRTCEGIEDLQPFHDLRAEAKLAVHKRWLGFVFAQGFAGSFSWSVITHFGFGLLKREVVSAHDPALLTMPVILVVAGSTSQEARSGSPSRSHAQRAFVRRNSQRLRGAIFPPLAIRIPLADRTQFFVLTCLTALRTPAPSPNAVSTRYDVAPPEVGSTTMPFEHLVENSRGGLAPLLAEILADATGRETSGPVICVVGDSCALLVAGERSCCPGRWPHAPVPTAETD